MKKIITKLFAIALAICLISTVFIACQNKGKYKVTYVAGDGMGTAPSEQYYNEGDKFNVMGNDVFTRNDYSFAGWNDGEKTVEAGSEYTMPAHDVVFTAQWQTTAQLEGSWSGSTVDGGEFIGIEGVTFNVKAATKKNGENELYLVLGFTGSVQFDSTDPSLGGSDEGDDSDVSNPDSDAEMGEGTPTELQGAGGETDSQDEQNDLSGESGGMQGESGGMQGESGGMQGESGDTQGESGDTQNTREVTMCAAFVLNKDTDGNYGAEECTVRFSDGKLTINIAFGSSETQTLEFTHWEELGSISTPEGTYTATEEDGYVHTITFGEEITYTVRDGSQNQGGGDSSQAGSSDSADSENGQADIRSQSDYDLNDSSDLRNGMGNDNDEVLDGSYNYNGIMPYAEDSEGTTDGNGDMTDGNGDMTDGNGGNTNDETVKTYDVEKLVNVGEYLVLFGNSDDTDQETELSPLLVLTAGESGELIANTGEGDRLVFTKASTNQASANN